MDKIGELLKETVVTVAPEAVVIVGLCAKEQAAAASHAAKDGVISFVSLPEEVTLILVRDAWQQIAGNFPSALVEEDYCLVTLQITLPWDVVGYLARVTEALAAVGVSVGVISSHASDHLLIKECALSAALAELKKLGCRV